MIRKTQVFVRLQKRLRVEVRGSQRTKIRLPELHISEQKVSIRTMMATSLEQHAYSPHGDILRIPGNLV